VPRLLIKVRKANWQKDALPSFVEEGDIPADCLRDLRVKDNQLSVWHVNDDNSNLKRVLTALAANAGNLSNTDYLLFDSQVVTTLGLNIKKTEGGTPDRQANREWHHDLVHLSGRKILDLAITMLYQSKTDRVLEKTVSIWITTAITNNEIDSSRLSPGLAAKVVRTGTPKIQQPTISRLLRMCTKICSSTKEAWREFRQQ
jgi:hypothetical protein